jgi:uncharacterized protein (DUF4415 family)
MILSLPEELEMTILPEQTTVKTEKKPGRPKKPNMVLMTIKIDEELADMVRSQPDKYSVTIERALKLLFKTDGKKTCRKQLNNGH